MQTQKHSEMTNSYTNGYLHIFLKIQTYKMHVINRLQTEKIETPFILINNIPALVQITAWCQPGNKLLSESMMVSLLTQIFITRPQ